MKKIERNIFILIALLGIISISAQDKIGLQKYDYVTNGDANLFQGIPNISFPLFNVAVPTAGININLSLNYNSESASSFSLISDVGKGWNLSSIGNIVRNKTRIDTDFYMPTGDVKEAGSDVYYYDYPNGSGKFYIGMDKITGELTGVHTTPSNDKIIITKDDAKPNKVKSFTIIDTKGNRYVFDKTNINKLYIGDGFDTTAIAIAQKSKFINSGFFLSKIINVKNEEVVSIEYLTASETINLPSGTLQSQKIKKITINGVGSIEYDYLNNGTPTNLNSPRDKDWYVLKKVMLKNTQNQIVNQYWFTNTGYLKELVNMDKNNNPIQKFSFEYNNGNSVNNNSYIDGYGYPIVYDPCSLDEGELPSPYQTNRKSVSYGSLKRIILPTGGITEYEFESHSLPFSESPCSGPTCYYDNYDFDKIYTLNFDTKLATQHTITLPSGYQNKLFVKYNYTIHPGQTGNPGSSNVISYTINGKDPQTFLNPYTQQECPDVSQFAFTNQVSLNVKFTGLKKGYGTVEIYAAKQQKRDKNKYAYGLRIKSIKNFNPGSLTPISYTRYEYDTFSDPLLSSGDGLDISEDISYLNESPKAAVPIGYTNVKTINMIDGSYSKYYFYPQSTFAGLTSSFNSIDDKDMRNYFRMAGLLQKKEDYSPTNQLLQKSEMQYTYKDVPLANINFNGNPVKKINISKQSSTTENYIAGTTKKLVSSSESQFEDIYNNMTSSKETLSDGTIVEKTILYPADKGIQKLMTANMVDVPLETSVKKNGKLIGKAETKFDNAAHLYPTSMISYNMENQTAMGGGTLDIYDNKGNLVQTTAKNGIPTTTIWGYYQSQPIAVISGATYSQVANLTTVKAAITASNNDRDNPATEPALLTALENLRNDIALKDFSITATTYDPLIGVTNSISANGIRMTNVYDNANRLIKVTNAEGKTLQEYQYNYKQ
ncbi:hypothetical protein PFY10_20410 [Chryseobacterium daecheongense]|nr:hypothetical protein PFY10_20410 [Chryseobacterium daecheongense]